MERKSTDIVVKEVRTRTEHYPYRMPLKFGGVAVCETELLNVEVQVESRAGRRAWGEGSMPFGNTWAFPSKRVPYEQTLGAMRRLSELIAAELPRCALSGHPVELAAELEPRWLELAERVSQQLRLAEPIPKLATLVVASPFDAAVHDAYGKLHGRHVYECYGPEWFNHDLSEYLDDQFRGEHLDRYVLKRPKPRMPLYHLIGALDPLTDADLTERIDDGLPNTLAEWILHDELTHMKIKLNGNDADWDTSRILSIEAVAAETQARRGCRNWLYSLDFNEQCPNVGYLIEVLRRVRESNESAYRRVAYIEQPTARDLKAHPENRMHAAARLKPVVIDESLVDYESLLLAREQGYTGVALKACKGQSQALPPPRNSTCSSACRT